MTILLPQIATITAYMVIGQRQGVAGYVARQQVSYKCYDICKPNNMPSFGVSTMNK